MFFLFQKKFYTFTTWKLFLKNKNLCTNTQLIELGYAKTMFKNAMHQKKKFKAYENLMRLWNTVECNVLNCSNNWSPYIFNFILTLLLRVLK